MRGLAAIAVTAVLMFGSMAGAQTTRPAMTPDPRLELRANQAFNRGEYAVALPMLRTLAEAAKNEPSRLGAIQEKVRVCQTALDALKAVPTGPPADPQT